jgi:copper oxidase (laccase) domain-containing protein
MVYPARYGEITYADGAMISDIGSAIILQAADCAVLALSDITSGKVVAAHAGRPALSPEGHCFSCNVTGNALHTLLGHEGDRSAVVALVTGNICGPCFKHDRDDARKLVEHFLRYPVDVFADRATRALDLFKVIKHQLMHEGVLEEHIRHEGPCTLETPALSSHRRGDKTRNTFVIVKIK